MPFTLSHAVLIVPIRKYLKTGLSSSGFIAGCMSPDMEYFIRMHFFGNFGHSFLGIFLFDIPIGLLMCQIYHDVLKEVSVTSSPRFISSRLSRWNSFVWDDYLYSNKMVVISSIGLGALSHIIWDHGTHFDGYFIHFFGIQYSKFSIMKYSIYWYDFLQYGCSVLGLLVLGNYFFKLPKDDSIVNKFDKQYFITVFLISINIFFFRLLVGYSELTYKDILSSAISCMLIGWIVGSCFYRFKEIKSSFFDKK